MCHVNNGNKARFRFILEKILEFESRFFFPIKHLVRKQSELVANDQIFFFLFSTRGTSSTEGYDENFCE